ncbi:MAG TPA: response regulator [Desulfuromonadales bacterium]|nr:response regulator [Desulfuromonadales bacterium]
MSSRVLLAEDNDQLAAALEALLTRQGLAVERAGDGVEALGRIAQSPPDLLLLDLKLPRLHGIELLKRLRQNPHTSGLPVVIITGAYRGDPYVRAAKALGIAAYLEKPFKAGELLAALKQALPADAPLSPPAPTTETVDAHLRRAFIGRFCGRLVLRGEGREYSLTLISGTPVFVRPGFAYRDFGDWLHRRGFLSAEEYAFYAGPGQHRYELPVQMGCIEYPDLLEEKLAYLSAELVESFALPPLTAVEHPFTPPPGLQLLTVNVPRIFYQGYHRYLRPEQRERLLTEDGPRFAALAPDYFRYVNFLSLSHEERQLLPRLDGTRPLADCLAGEADLIPLALTLQALGMLRCADVPLTLAAPEFPLRILFNAVAEETAEIALEGPLESFADLVEPAAQAATPAIASVSPTPPSADVPGEAARTAEVRKIHASLQGKNYYEIFGLTQATFSFDQLKENYFSLTRQFGPDLLMQLAGAEATMAEEILAAVANAYNTLSDVVRKENYDQLLGSDRVGLGQKGDDRFQAQVQSQSGKVFIQMEEWDNAETALQDACNIDPNNGDYLAHLAWAIYRNPRNAASRAMQEKARQLLNRALTLERTAAGFAFKGWLLFEAGEDTLAEAEFNKALKLDARQLMARKGLKSLLETREREKKGLFRRMFG